MSSLLHKVLTIVRDNGHILSNDHPFNILNDSQFVDGDCGDRDGSFRLPNDTFITGVKWYKYLASPFYEFLLFDATEPASAHKSVILRLERKVSRDGNFIGRYFNEKISSGPIIKSPEDVGAITEVIAISPQRPSGANRTPPVPDALNTHVQAHQSRRLETNPVSPREVVTEFSSKKFDFHGGHLCPQLQTSSGHELIARLEIKGEYFSVSHLAALANLVGNHLPKNTPINHRLLFEDIIYSVLKRSCPNVMEHRGPAYSRRGKFHGEQAYRIEELWISDLTQTFNQLHWPLFKANLQDPRTRKRYDQEILREAETTRRQEEMAKRRAEEDERKAEEKANANESVIRREEAKRREAEDRIITAEAEKRRAEVSSNRLRC